MKENVEEYVEQRIEECKEIFSLEEYKIINDNKNFTKKVYILGALDGYTSVVN